MNNSRETPNRSDVWPELPLDAWRDTYATLHMWLQIVGKVRLTLSPPINHWWHSTLYVTPRGLTTSAIPYGDLNFDIEFDFVNQNLQIRVSDGGSSSLTLKPQTVAAFYVELIGQLGALGIDVAIHAVPDEVPEPIPFAEDATHKLYDPEHAYCFWQILVQCDRVFKQFRSDFIGKCSPVHFFWGSFDLAVTRFSGRRAPERKDGGALFREGYSHECSSAGFWPGSGPIQKPSFYSYTVPSPAGFDREPIRPEQAYFSPELGEYLLDYDVVRLSESPDQTLMDFLKSTYEAGANLGGWDRSVLEGHPMHQAGDHKQRSK